MCTLGFSLVLVTRAKRQRKTGGKLGLLRGLEEVGLRVVRLQLRSGFGGTLGGRG